nr:MAG TPA: hypothetical protein [Caudoviricetes sp.]
MLSSFLFLFCRLFLLFLLYDEFLVLRLIWVYSCP